MLKLWFEQHERFNYQLHEHEEDEIEDYEGHDLIEMPAEQDHNDMAWLFPQRGPGQFKEKVERKKKKSENKKKGKKGQKKGK